MADDDPKPSGTSLSPKLSSLDPWDKDLDWVGTRSQADQLTYFQERVGWQQAKLKFEVAQASAAEARQQPSDALESLKTAYKGALAHQKAAQDEAAKLRGKVKSAQEALDSDDADDAEKTAASLKTLQDSIDAYGKQAAEVAKAKTSLDQAQAALTAAADSKTKKNFNFGSVALDEDVAEAAEREYKLALANASEVLDTAKQKFDDVRKELKKKAPTSAK